MDGEVFLHLGGKTAHFPSYRAREGYEEREQLLALLEGAASALMGPEFAAVIAKAVTNIQTATR